VAAYLQKITIFFIELTKVGASADVFHSRTLSRVLGKISDGRHIGADHLDCTGWRMLGIKAAAWVDTCDDDSTTVTWRKSSWILRLRTMPFLHTLARDYLVEILLDQQQELLDSPWESALKRWAFRP